MRRDLDTALLLAGLAAAVALPLLSLLRLAGVIDVHTDKAIGAGLVAVILLFIILSMQHQGRRSDNLR